LRLISFRGKGAPLFLSASETNVTAGTLDKQQAGVFELGILKEMELVFP
jgi:hypothetical protein